KGARPESSTLAVVTKRCERHFCSLHSAGVLRTRRGNQPCEIFALALRHPAIELRQIRHWPLRERCLLQVSVGTELRCDRERVLSACGGCERDASPPGFVREQLGLVFGGERVGGLWALCIAHARVHMARAADRECQHRRVVGDTLAYDAPVTEIAGQLQLGQGTEQLGRCPRVKRRATAM